MLRASVIAFGSSWDSYLPIAELSYNNIYHSSIGAPPFEILYGRDLFSPVFGGEVGQKFRGRAEVVLQTIELIQQIRQRL